MIFPTSPLVKISSVLDNFGSEKLLEYSVFGKKMNIEYWQLQTSIFITTEEESSWLGARDIIRKRPATLFLTQYI